MVKATSPVDGHIAFLSIQSRGTFHTTTGADAAELKEAVEHRTVVSYIELCLLPLEVVHVLGADLL